MPHIPSPGSLVMAGLGSLCGVRTSVTKKKGVAPLQGTTVQPCFKGKGGGCVGHGLETGLTLGATVPLSGERTLPPCLGL